MCRRSRNATASRGNMRFLCWSISIGNGSRAGWETPGWFSRKDSSAPRSVVVLHALARRLLEIADALANAASDFRQPICSENHDDDDQDDDQLRKAQTTHLANSLQLS